MNKNIYAKIMTDRPGSALTEELVKKPNPIFLRLTGHLAYPLLVLAALGTVITTLTYQQNYALANGLFLGFTLSYLAFMERLIPYDRAWHPLKKEWLLASIYLLITMLGAGLAMMTILSLSSLLHPKKAPFPFAVEIFIALILSSLGSYLFHRYSHTQPWLWRLHGIHHVPAKVNVGNNGVNHILDVFGRRFFAQLLVMLMGISEDALFVVSIFNIVQGYFSHANIDVKLGWLNYVVVGPEQHRLHNSKDLREAKHFSVDIPLWDAILGSYVWKPGRVPKEVGVVEPKKFPPADAIMQSLLSPFRPRKRKKRPK